MTDEDATRLYHAINYVLLGMSKVESEPSDLAIQLVETRNKLVLEHKLTGQNENPFNDYTTAFGDTVEIGSGTFREDPG